MADQTKDTRTRLLDVAEGLILEQGFAGTSVDAIIGAAGVTKGAFFHHFPTKAALARTLMERYAAADAEHLETYMERAERLSDDPLQQILIFVGLFEESLADIAVPNPGCLFASYAYEAGLFDEGTLSLIRGSVESWRQRVRAKLEEVALRYPPRVDVDLDSLANLLWVIFEGGFILSRTTADSGAVSVQLRQYRTYLQALFSPQ